MTDLSSTFPATRRGLLGLLGVGVAAGAVAWVSGIARGAAIVYPVHFTEEQWKKRLTPPQFAILRQSDTERPFSSPLLNEHRKGTFCCAADRNQLYASTTKFDSGTGWPSFWQPLPHGVATSTDLSLGIPRTEVHCTQCGGHLGHVFDDGPPPTGKRYCMNGAGMAFKPT